MIPKSGNRFSDQIMRQKQENTMNEDAFNMSVRKFLKKVGVTSQREIEQAVRDAAAAGKLKGGALPAKATFTIGGVNLTLDVT
jgi:hypothetical protein